MFRVRQHSCECRIYPYQLHARFSRIRQCNRAAGRRPNPPIEREVEEAAMPGRQPALARLRTAPGNSPSRIASCHQRHRDHRSTDQKALTFSL